MRRLKLILMSVGLLLCSAFCMTALTAYLYPVEVYAASDADTSVTFNAQSKEVGGDVYDCSDEYVVLNEDGSGMVVADKCAYTIEWSVDGEQLSWTDHMGKQFEGTITDGKIQGTYRKNTYTYTQASNAAPITTLAPDRWHDGLACVTDQADILTDDEADDLNARAREISDQYQCMVYIVTLDDMRNFTQSYSIETCAEEIRAGYDLGYGNGRDLVMLVLSMAERDYDLMAFGDFGNATFTDYGKSVVEEEFLDDFRDDEWYNGFADYLSQCENLLQLSADGEPLDVAISSDYVTHVIHSGSYIVASVLISLLIGFIIAMIICFIIRATMRKTSEKTDAANYVLKNGVHIVRRQDLFMRTSETRVYDPPESSSNSGGTSTSSSGSSHSSGKF